MTSPISCCSMCQKKVESRSQMHPQHTVPVPTFLRRLYLCFEFCRRLDIGEKYNNLSLETSAKLRDLARGISLFPHGGQQIRYNHRCFMIFFSSGLAVLRIRDVYSDPGSEFFPSRIRIKEFQSFNPKKWFHPQGNMIRVVHFGCRIQILTFYPSRISDPGVKKAAAAALGLVNPDPDTDILLKPDPYPGLADPALNRIHMQTFF